MAGDLTFNQATTDRNRQGAPIIADPPARNGAFEALQERSTRSSAANARAPGERRPLIRVAGPVRGRHERPFCDAALAQWQSAALWPQRRWIVTGRRCQISGV